MQNWMTWAASGLALTGFAMGALSQEAQARPPYQKEFMGQYEKVKPEAEKVKCLICHYGDSKKNRNDYGKAFGEALGGPNVKDAEKIVAALKKAEEGKSATEGKTFGDLLNEGKLPGKNP